MFKNFILPLQLILSSTLVSNLDAQDKIGEGGLTPNSAEVDFISQFLGRGYDACKGEYADADDIKAQVYQTSSFEDGTTTPYFEFFRNTIQTDKITTGKTAKSFSKELAANAGLKVEGGLYYGEVQMNFQSTEAGATDESFAALNDSKQIFTAKLGRSPEVNPRVLKELNWLSPDQVIRKYGTHVNVGLRFGGRIEFTYSEKASRNSDSTNLSALVKGAYEGVSAEAGAAAVNKHEEARENGKMNLEIHGGKPVALTVDNFRAQSSQGDFIKSQYAEWAASVVSQPTMIGYTDRGLQPIWEVAGLRQNRGAELKAAVKTYADECAKGVTDRPLNNLRTPITRVQRITLKHDGGQYIGGIYDGSDWFPTQGNSGLEIHLYHNQSYSKIHGDPTELKSGDIVSLAVVGGNSGKGRNIWLTVQSGNDAYLQPNHHHQKAKWKIWPKGTNGKPDGDKGNDGSMKTIRDGDMVAFENADYPGRYLGPDGKYWDIQSNGTLNWFEIRIMR